jgi:hypothetical protein
MGNVSDLQSLVAALVELPKGTVIAELGVTESRWEITC